jgi:dienelactone hydrolase
VPKVARGVVLFAHGSGSSRHSPRNRLVARLLNEVKLATLLVDLLTPQEEAIDLQTARLRFDISLLAKRLVGATDWLARHPDTRALRFGYFGASTGAAAALVAAAERPQQIDAVVSRGGRPDLAGPALERVRAPTLLIVGGNDFSVIEMNQTALTHLCCEKQLVIVPAIAPGPSATGLAGRVQVLMDELHGRRAFAHSGGDSLHRPVADIAGGKDPGDARFQPERLALEGPVLRARCLAVGARQIRVRQDEAVTVSLHDAVEPLRVGHGADEDSP